MRHVLVCDDEKDIVSALNIYLSAEGYRVLAAYNGKEALSVAAREDVHLILMDIMMPVMDGISAMVKIRERSNVPVILLTAKGEDSDKILGLNVGADDYVVKPYRPAALLARIDRALARSGSADSARGQIDHGGVSLDSVRAVVSYRGKRVELSRNELLILRILMENAGSIISRSELMDELWQTDAFVDDNTLTVNVNRLRAQLAKVGVEGFLVTHRGQGYSVQA